MKLVYDKTNDEVKTGDLCTLRDGEKASVVRIEKPRHGGSTGRVFVKSNDSDWSQGFFPTVIGATWIEREDR